MQNRIRSLIVIVLGHVDHGKTTLLDKIRGTTVALKEPGQITQHIGATYIPLGVLEKIAGPLIKKFNIEIKIPGFLVIDTPGHELFTNLRRRGGAIADIAILVIDVMSGVKPQTVESIHILQTKKTPFLVAANKIDLVRGWRQTENNVFIESLEKQSSLARNLLEQKIYELISQLSELGFDSDYYFRVKNFREKVAIVPLSAKTGEGIPDLIVVLLGLAQRFLMERLMISGEKGKGTVLEVKEEPGLGTTIDVILYDGKLKMNDLVVVGRLKEALITKVKGLFLPKQFKKGGAAQFEPVNEVESASGVKVLLQETEGLIAGAPVQVVENIEEAEEVKREIEKEISKVLIKTGKVGVIVKSDSIGTLEALISYLRNKGIPIRFAGIGRISRKNIIEASIVREKEEKYAFVLGFNVKISPDAEEEARIQNIPVITSKVIYQLIEEYEKKALEIEERKREEKIGKIPSPSRIQFLKGYVFRRSKPAIFGVEVLAGKIKPETPLMNLKGSRVGVILQIQKEGKPIPSASRGERVAISVKGPTVGRQIKEGDILYTDIPLNKIYVLKNEIKTELTPEEKEVLSEIREIKLKKVFTKEA